VLYEPGMSCRLYVCVNLVHCVLLCWQINDDDDIHCIVIPVCCITVDFLLVQSAS